MAIETQLKQRLVGIAVIVSLAVIFLPMILDGAGMVKETDYKTTTIHVPPPPEVERTNIDLSTQAQQLNTQLNTIPQLDNTLVDVSNREQKSKEKVPPKATLTDNSEVTKPELKKMGGDTWIAQLGSFKDQDKAFKLQDKVRGYKIAPVFIQKAVIKGSKNYRVRMGPFLYQKQAVAAIKKLTKRSKIKAVVMKHDQ